MQSKSWEVRWTERGRSYHLLSVLDYIVLCGRLLGESTQEYTDRSMKVPREWGQGAWTDSGDGATEIPEWFQREQPAQRP